jgi:hypothetical protein
MAKAPYCLAELGLYQNKGVLDAITLLMKGCCFDVVFRGLEDPPKMHYGLFKTVPELQPLLLLLVIFPNDGGVDVDLSEGKFLK